jgi:galactoside O-acetyltransferase
VSNPFQSRYYDAVDLRKLGFKRVGSNVSVSEHATIVGIENISIGSNVRIDSHVVILSKQGETDIGSNVHIEPSASLVSHSGIEIGNFCTISHGVRLFTASANYDGEYFTNVFPDPKFQVPFKGKIVLEDHVIIGGNSVVMPGVHFGEGSAIGALSFVRKDVEPWGIYAGNPLKFLRKRKKTIKKLSMQF